MGSGNSAPGPCAYIKSGPIQGLLLEYARSACLSPLCSGATHAGATPDTGYLSNELPESTRHGPAFRVLPTSPTTCTESSFMNKSLIIIITIHTLSTCSSFLYFSYNLNSDVISTSPNCRKCFEILLCKHSFDVTKISFTVLKLLT